MTRVLPILMGALLILGIGDLLALGLAYWWPGRTFSGGTSGVWTAVAYDLSHGLLYRPVVSEMGYGGTRYMPLMFGLHAGLIALGLGATVAGVVAMQASVLAMVGVLAALLRQAGLSLGWALAVASLTFCTTIHQQFVADINADYLAAALSLGGLWLYLRAGDVGLWRLLGVSILCVLAVFAKFTTLYVPLAILLHLFFTGRYRLAAIFSGLGIGLLVIGVFGVNTLSEGRMFAAFQAAGSGGTSLEYAAGFLGRFGKEVFYFNPEIGLCWVLALILVLRGDTWTRDQFALVFLCTSLVTVLTFVSRGIAGNHVIVLHAVSLLVLGRGLIRAQKIELTGAVIVMLVVSVLILVPGFPSPRKTLMGGHHPSLARLETVVNATRIGNGPIFATNPALPVVLGQPVFLADPFNLRHFIASDPKIATDLAARFERQEFSLLLVHWTNDFKLPGQDLSPMEEHYELVEQLGQIKVMAPKTR